MDVTSSIIILAGIFTRLLPLAHKHGSRVVLMQRRDYPGAEPLNEEELRLLSSTPPATPQAAANMELYTKQRAQEFNDFLVNFVCAEDIPVEGGLVLVGWSFGAIWITGLLAYAASFSVNDVELCKYIRRVIIYGRLYLEFAEMAWTIYLFFTDAPIMTLGFSPPVDSYNPLSHPSHSPGEGVKLFPSWVSGYYRHGESVDELEQRTALTEPRPSILRMSPEDVSNAVYSGPAQPGGSDNIFMESGIHHKMFKSLKERAFYLTDGSPKSDWDGIELRYIWCEQSVWEMPFTAWTLQAELKEAEKAGKRLRKVTWMRLKKANHFVGFSLPFIKFYSFLTGVCMAGALGPG